MLKGKKPSAVAEKSTVEWLNTKWFAALLGLVIVASFPAVVVGFQAFAYGDAGQFAYPVAFYDRACFWRGEFPFWNPLNSCGIPFMAQWNTMTLYPLSLFYLLLPVPWSFDFFCLGHLFLGGMGMYLLAYRWTGHRLASALAGVVFAFNGLTWYGIMWPHLLAALGWMPWVMLAMERAWRDGGKCVMLAALAAGVQLLTGGVEVIIQTWMVVAVFWVAALFQARSQARRMVARGLGAGLLAAGLAMAQLLPFLQLLSHSQRTAGYADSEHGKIAAMAVSGWANYLVPLFRGLPNFNGVLKQLSQSWTGSYYLGVGIILVALLAVWRVRDARVRLLFGLALFGFIMALGPAGLLESVIIRVLPVLGYIRYPVKFVILPTFALPLLGAFGLRWLIGLAPEKWPKEWKLTKGLALGLLLTIGCIIWIDKLHPAGPGSHDAVLANGCIRGLFLLAAAACVPLLRQFANIKVQRLAQLGLLLCAWLDVLTHEPNLTPTVATNTWEPGAVRQFFRWDDRLRAGTSRAMRNKQTFWKMLTSGSTDPDVDLQGRRLSLFMNLNLVDQIAKFDGFYSLDLKEHLDLFKHVYFSSNEAPGLLDFMGISELGDPTNVVAWIHRNTYRPLITTGQQPIYLDPRGTLEAIFADNFNPSQTIYLPMEAKGTVQASRSANARILSPRFLSQRLEFEVQSDFPAVVAVAQTYYPAWHAYEDGKPTTLWRANYAFQAVEVSPGRHRVSLRYEDRPFYCGVIISVVSLSICGGAWLRLRLRKDGQ